MTAPCRMPPTGWQCTRHMFHDGPCAALPRWWNWGQAARRYRRSWLGKL